VLVNCVKSNRMHVWRSGFKFAAFLNFKCSNETENRPIKIDSPRKSYRATSNVSIRATSRPVGDWNASSDSSTRDPPCSQTNLFPVKRNFRATSRDGRPITSCVEQKVGERTSFHIYPKGFEGNALMIFRTWATTLA